MARNKEARKLVEVNPEEMDLGRFAGSSDEEEDEAAEVDADDEDSDDSSDEPSLVGRKIETNVSREGEGIDDSEDDLGGIFRANDAINASSKMADAMARILGASTKSSVVLSKTTTPLQRMQKEVKEARKALKAKRQLKKDRNLNSLHIPLSVATTFAVEGGGRSVARELEQERFHRRVATRGVVALFNAISSHQKSTEGESDRKRQGDTARLTKHAFLDKIKSVASASSSKSVDAAKPDSKEGAKWDALKEDYLMDSSKHWDENSSGDEGVFEEEPTESNAADQSTEHTRRKKPRVGGKE